jgi:glycopeptide antibiotics resistance protein
MEISLYPRQSYFHYRYELLFKFNFVQQLVNKIETALYRFHVGIINFKSFKQYSVRDNLLTTNISLSDEAIQFYNVNVKQRA